VDILKTAVLIKGSLALIGPTMLTSGMKLSIVCPLLAEILSVGLQIIRQRMADQLSYLSQS
jgi:hypothetical protein